MPTCSAQITSAPTRSALSSTLCAPLTAGEDVRGGDESPREIDPVELAGRIECRRRRQGDSRSAGGHGQDDELALVRSDADDQAGVGGVEHPELPAVQAVAAIVSRDVELNLGGVPAPVRLEKCDRRAELTVGDRLELASRGRTAQLGEERRRPERRQERPGQTGPPHLFGDDGQLDQAQAKPADRLGKVQSDPALLGDSPPEIRVER